ncbi:MAG: zinc ribbon domain-containing protein [Candidatus Nanoarchaeia archaeon]|nr:zinc ribbon domain-containing protein [Candidatus Nanoarchaeia archaeon]
MPLYEYHCEKCDRTYEEIKPAGTDRTECPDCKGLAKRVLSVSAKGSNSKGSSSGSSSGYCPLCALGALSYLLSSLESEMAESSSSRRRPSDFSNN